MGKEKAEGEGKVEGGERKGIILRGEGRQWAPFPLHLSFSSLPCPSPIVLLLPVPLSPSKCYPSPSPPNAKRNMLAQLCYFVSPQNDRTISLLIVSLQKLMNFF